MEIPYIVNARRDTGLNNSKIAIWLFLASEVMLFGGLFSSYIFLRIFADYPWPERALPILPGLLNTFILIASSVTVVFAWAGLKLRKWKMFVGNMTFTIVCAAIFMCFKAKEYSEKLHHHASQTEDYAWIEGHLDPDHPNRYKIAANTINFALGSTSTKYLNAIIAQAAGNLPTLIDPYKVRFVNAGKIEEKVLFEAGTQLSEEVISLASREFIKARSYNQNIRTELLKQAWMDVRDPDKHPELVDLADFESKVKSAVSKVHVALVKDAESNSKLLLANGNMVFNSNDAIYSINTGWGRMSNASEAQDSTVSLLDGTVLSGTAGDSSLIYEYVDGIDFRHLALKAETKGLDIEELIEKSPILNLKDQDGENGGDKIREIWEAHKIWRDFLAQDLLKRKDWLTGTGRVPTELDLYRVTWQQMVAYDSLKKEMIAAKKIPADAVLKDAITAENWMKIKDEHQPSMIYDITGKTKAHKATFPHNIKVARDEVRFDSLFSPKMNNYYAIYFTITGLHGLHVIGGAIVLGYYLFFGRKMYLSNPEWLANRVEVGGLFWHFVDLVWIFVFPIFYLM